MIAQGNFTVEPSPDDEIEENNDISMRREQYRPPFEIPGRH